MYQSFLDKNFLVELNIPERMQKRQKLMDINHVQKIDEFFTDFCDTRKG